MTRSAAASTIALSLLLAACGGGNETSDKLENAAEQSNPAAAEVLLNAAEAMEDGNASAGAAQQALQDAGNAQATTVPQTGTDGVPGARPRQPGDPVPPVKVTTGNGQ